MGLARANRRPLTGRSNTGGFSIAGTAMPGSPDSLIRVTPGYFSLMGIALRQD